MPEDVKARASDPQTDQATLQKLAFDYPELRPLIAVNPSAHPGLLEWLKNLHDPAVDEAILVRERFADVGRGSAGAESATIVVDPGVIHPDPAAPVRPSDRPQRRPAIEASANSEFTQDPATDKAVPPTQPAWLPHSAETSPVDQPTQTMPPVQTKGAMGPPPMYPGAVRRPPTQPPSSMRPGVAVPGAVAPGVTDPTRAPRGASPGSVPRPPTQPPSSMRQGGLPPVVMPIPAQRPPVQQGLQSAQLTHMLDSPAPTPSPTPPTRNSNKLKGILIGLIVIAVLLLAAVVLTVTGKLDFLGREDTQSAVPSSHQSDAEPPESDQSPSGTASPSDKRDIYPAPASATKVAAVSSPTGNIKCDLGEDTVSCVVVEQSFSSNGYTACGNDEAVVLAANEKTAGLNCGGAVSGGSPLAYGTVATNGHSACTSYETGMTCWNTKTGMSFAVAREGWKVGKTGAFEESAVHFRGGR